MLAKWGAAVPMEDELAGFRRMQFREEFDSSRAEMATLLRELSQECGQFYAQSEWITILGV